MRRLFIHIRRNAGGSTRATLLLLVLLAGTSLPASGQTASLSGFVTDQSDGRGLEFVSVVLRGEDEFLRGTTTNRDGLYLMARLRPGRYTLEISYIGYEIYSETLDLTAGVVRTRNVALRPAEAELDEVLVETERTSGAARVTAGQQTIRPREIEAIPTPDVSGDLASYLVAQPGIVTTGDRGGQLFIRGGEPSQNLVQVDGILLYQPFHIVGFYSAFPSDIINRVDLYAGGYGGKFGGGLSSVVDVTTRNGNARQPAGAVAVSPFMSSLLLEGPLVRDRVSLLASARRSTIEWGAARYVDQPLPFTFGDVFAKLHGVLSENGRASITAMRTFDRGILTGGATETPPEEINWQNDAVGLRFFFLPRIFPFMTDVHVSHSRLQARLGVPGEPARISRINNTYMALEATYFDQYVDVQAGSTLRLSTLDSEVGGLFQNIEFRISRIAHWGSYLDFDVRVGRGLRVRPSIRAQFYKVRFEPYLEPRLRAVWDWRHHQVSAAVGIYQQEIIGLSDRRDAATVFTVWTNIPKSDIWNETPVQSSRPQRALHAIAGYRTNPAPWLEASVEGFYKNLSKLFIAEWTAFPRFTTRLQPASGRAMGVEARLEFRRRPFYGYVNYGLSSTRYNAEQLSLQLWYGEESLRFRPPHDRRHQVNLVASTALWGFNLNARWEFGSGLPFSRAVAFDGFALIEDIVKTANVPSSRRVIYERPYDAELPTYHRLDVSVDRTFSLRWISLTVQGSVINAYNRRNLYYLDVFTLRRVDQLPLVPSLGLKVAFD